MGEFLSSYAWDARGGGWAREVPPQAWQDFHSRLTRAKEMLTRAWEMNHANADAAALMITIEMGIGEGPADMERWFARAMEADPGNPGAVGRKMQYLEPKWHGSPAEMIRFGRDMVELAASDPADPRRAALPLVLTERTGRCPSTR